MPASAEFEVNNGPGSPLHVREEGASNSEMQLVCVRETVEPSHDSAPSELELHAEGNLNADTQERDGDPSAILDEQSVLPPSSIADLKDFQRDLEGGCTEHDNCIDAGGVPLVCEPCQHPDTETELESKMYENINPLTVAHLSTHLPRCKPGICAGCDYGKTAKSPSRRRQNPKVTVLAPDAETQPFGALVHMDTIEMERGSDAARAARYSLNVSDDLTDFTMAFPFWTHFQG